MIAKFYGKNISLQQLREQSHISREGVSMLGLSKAAEAKGFRTKGVKLNLEQIINEAPLPCIVHWDQHHFVVLYKTGRKYVRIADPAIGLQKITHDEFGKHFLSVKEDEPSGICLLLEPSPAFYQSEDEEIPRNSFSFIWQYVKIYKRYLFQLSLGLLFGSLLQLIFPFLTQSVVDIGINTGNISFIYLVLIAQFVLFISRMAVDFIRNWILLFLSTRINISLISDFLVKLMKLPVSFFDTRVTGDLMQRIYDQRRIESFFTTSTLSVLFSLVNLLIFGIVLAIYSLPIFFVFIAGSLLYVLWILLFMKKRKSLDYRKFSKLSESQHQLIQLFSGIHEIKMNNCEQEKRWEWESTQARLFKINIKSLSLQQYQQAGTVFFNESKNIIITIMSALAVLHGQMTLGMMIAVQYIIGQLNGPLTQMISFMQNAQDAGISIDRMSEIHAMEEEDQPDAIKTNVLPSSKSIHLNELIFQYEGPESPKVLNGINLEIPDKKVTAIVGLSGSGKTTLIKLLLGFYQPVSGEIRIGGTILSGVNMHFWRSQCGAVLQDGYIFSGSILSNIIMRQENYNREQLEHAVNMANIKNFIETLPAGYNALIGSNGAGLSQGQKQRILIARAIYKKPEYLFFDEATNSLDANNEKVIMENLEKVFQGRTVIVVAHRLSTVKNADQIVVMDKGQIVEKGTHIELTAKKGAYYTLVKNQLELGT